jgi:hypothetical protein
MLGQGGDDDEEEGEVEEVRADTRPFVALPVLGGGGDV